VETFGDPRHTDGSRFPYGERERTGGNFAHYKIYERCLHSMWPSADNFGFSLSYWRCVSVRFEEGNRVTRCVEPRSQPITVRCSLYDEMISIRSAYYARLPVNTARFCEQPSPDTNRRDCVPHAAADRNSVANACNTYHSCKLYPNYHEILSSCSNVSGQVYANVDFDCLTRELFLTSTLSDCCLRHCSYS